MAGPSLSVIAEFDSWPVAAAVFELDGTFVAINRASELLLGRARADVIGRKAWELAPGMDHVWDDVLATTRADGIFRGTLTVATPLEPRPIHYVNTLRHDQGTSYVLSFAIELPYAAAPDTPGADDSKHRLEALGLVAGAIAHDYNNQLVSVLAEASAAREDTALGEATREALRRIEAAAHRMAQLTRQLLAYAGRGRFITEVIDPDELLRQMHDALVRAVREQATLAVVPGAGRVAIHADRVLLRQVIINLVVNASDALGDAAGTIGVATRVDDTSWLLEITDTGLGMDAKTIARIFDPFFTTKRDRHGLGLSAVHGIVRRLGGTIGVDSEPGRGTTISVRLPIVAGVEPERRRATSKQPPLVTLQGIRVLVADDEPSVRATIKRLLDRRGAEVVLASDGAEAHAKLSDGAYHVVLFDVMMPELTGYQLLPHARRLQPNATVMLMSGYTDQQRTAFAGDDEPDVFLEKPFTAKVLDRAIDEVLARLR